MLVLRRFGEEESSQIDNGLQEPNTFVLTDNGNLKFSGPNNSEVKHKNPIDSNSVVDYDQASIYKLSLSDPQYVFDSKNVISRNLKFLLRRERDVWYLLYWPLHTSAFKRYYLHSMGKTRNKKWGLPSLSSDGLLNMRKGVENACDTFQTEKRDKKSFLDPTCNIVYSDKQCRESALFDDNLVDHGLKKGRYSEVLRALGAGDPPHCTSIGGPHMYASNNNLENSFLWDFKVQKREKYKADSDLTINVCKVINEANEINIEGSTLQANCGGGEVTNTKKQDPNLQEKDPTPQTRNPNSQEKELDLPFFKEDRKSLLQRMGRYIGQNANLQEEQPIPEEGESEGKGLLYAFLIVIVIVLISYFRAKG